jgi:CRISPR/Cas system CSM-associated protein Csm3 (group 7 of RAMP superfamily)
MELNMFLQPYNELRFTITLQSTSPLLIKESRYTDEDRKRWSNDRDDIKKRMPNVIPISRASRPEIERAVLDPRDPLAAVGRLPFFLPASSLRGVFRSHLERTLRSQDPPDQPRVCDPFEDDLAASNVSCSKALAERRERFKAAFRPYRLSCPVCRLFGSTLQAGRISFTDGERVEPSCGSLVQREHVRINRRTGAVTGAPLKFYGLLEAKFRFEVKLRNFELPHVMLMGVLLTDLERGNIAIGSGRNKGYGRVRLSACSIQLAYLGLSAPPDELRGVAEHTDPGTREWFERRYGVVSAARAVALSRDGWQSPFPWRHERELDFSEFQELWPRLSLGWNRVPLLSGRLSAEA